MYLLVTSLHFSGNTLTCKEVGTHVDLIYSCMLSYAYLLTVALLSLYFIHNDIDFIDVAICLCITFPLQCSLVFYDINRQVKPDLAALLLLCGNYHPV